jgi:phosphatidylinositol-3-phosphatase
MKLERLASAVLLSAVATVDCSSADTGTTGSALVGHPYVPGTIFTIVFENENADNLINPSNPFFWQLSQQYGLPVAYTSSTHPSLPNYIMMTSGSLNGVTTDSDPSANVTIPGSDNIADQLDGAGIKWRAYMESMGAACTTESSDLYGAHHDPFLYYWSMRMNTARCNADIVDFDANFTTDLASNAYRFMWITPNMCNDVHNCSTQTGDAWLKTVVTQIMASPGYQNGGAIFILTDEGSTRYLGASADLPVIVVSPNLFTTPYQTTTALDHRSYLATVEDILGLPRLPNTVGATSMDEFFNDTPSVGAGVADASAQQ